MSDKPDAKSKASMGAIPATVSLGIDKLMADPPSWMEGPRLGLLCNNSSVDSRLVHSRINIAELFRGRLKALYSPQHGFYAEKQDNMIESGDRSDPCLGLPVFSLYGRSRKPTAQMLEPIDILLVDLQDVGTRVYTFIYTLAYCMQAARRHGKTVVILDRPNPVGGLEAEGNCLDPECASFVGLFPLPMRHGLTIGELALLFNEHFGIGCRLEVIPMQGWQRRMLFWQTGLHWVAPSPNMPTAATSLVYPGQVLWEGTNVSEGRGTTQPFELFGAPFIDPDRLLENIDPDQLPGVVLRPTEFEPTSNKWRGRICRGFQIHVVDPSVFKPYRTGLTLLQEVIRQNAAEFQWKQPPYEYEFERMPIDLIIGDKRLRQDLERLVPVSRLEQLWREDLENFRQLSRKYWLYE